MKGILEFNLPEESEEHRMAVNANAAYAALDEIGNQVFRPARKHGYPQEEINSVIAYLDALVEKDTEHQNSDGTQKTLNVEHLIGLLEQEFYRIRRDWEV